MFLAALNTMLPCFTITMKDRAATVTEGIKLDESLSLAMSDFPCEGEKNRLTLTHGDKARARLPVR